MKHNFPQVSRSYSNQTQTPATCIPIHNVPAGSLELCQQSFAELQETCTYAATSVPIPALVQSSLCRLRHLRSHYSLRPQQGPPP